MRLQSEYHLAVFSSGVTTREEPTLRSLRLFIEFISLWSGRRLWIFANVSSRLPTAPGSQRIPSAPDITLGLVPLVPRDYLLLFGLWVFPTWVLTSFINKENL